MIEIIEQYKDFLKARNLSQNYANVMHIFLTYLLDKQIDYKNINQEVITNFFNDNSQYKINSKTQFIKAGRNFYTAFLTVPKEQNEWHKIKYFKVERRKPKFLTPEEVYKLISDICTFENRLIDPLKAEVLLKFVYYTGLRKQELLNLKRSDIDLNSNPAAIRIIGKGNKERFVYFSEKYAPKFKQRLISYFTADQETINAFNLTLGKINYLFDKMNKYLNTKRITPHVFRHSYGKYLLNKGVPITYISKLYGHSSINTTMIYLDPTEEMIKNTFKE